MPELTFGALRQLAGRLDLVLQNEYDFLSKFWNEKAFGFASNNPTLERVNVTSTCFCLLALLESPRLTRRFSKEHGTSGVQALDRLADVLLQTEWKSEDLEVFNIYTTPIVLTTLHKLKGQFTHEKAEKGIESILANVAARRAAAFGDYPESAFLSYWVTKALEVAVANSGLQESLRSRCSSTLERVGGWAESEVYRQLTFDSAVDAASFDPVQLAYALTIYSDGCRRSNKRPNAKTVSKGVEVVFCSQQPDGLWPKCHPIFHYGTRGNVYTFSFEMLDIFLSMASPFPQVFRNFADRLEKSLRWTEENVLTSNDTFQLEGWRSNQLPIQAGPEAWSTAAVFKALRKFRALVGAYLNDDVLEEFGATRFAAPDRSRFVALYDSEINVSGKPVSLKGIVQEHLVDPHMSPSASEPSNAKYSAIFFGPPGTAKTTLAEAVSRALGWPFIYLQTSDFLSDGWDRVTGRARYIFEKLKLLERAVVLFDEVEEFVRDRQDPNLDAPSRMITTSMLTLIQDLRRQGKVIFVIATNRLAAFDPAITRAGGRFDLILLIPPPSLSERLRRLGERLVTINASEPAKKELEELFGKFAEQHYADSFRYFSFAEWDILLTEVLKKFQSAGSVSDADLKEMRNRHEPAITLRGDLRREYMQSLDRSRIF